MSDAGPRAAHPAWRLALEIAGSPRFNQTFATVVVFFAFATHPLAALLGEPGVIAILVALDVLAAFALAGQWERVEWQGLLPISLLALFGWIGLTIVWSQYQWATLGGIAYAYAFGFLGLYLALGRDVLQIMRATGDALRFYLVVSMAVEILSGILLDAPIPVLGVQGLLAEGGPVQGIAGSRNYLGFIALLAVVTFLLELLTRSVERPLALGSIALALATIALTRSPVTIATAAVVVLGLVVLAGLRRARGDVRQAVQIALVVVIAAAGVAAWTLRSQIVSLLGLAPEIQFRTSLWRLMLAMQGDQSLVGLGWVGPWNTAIHPFATLGLEVGRAQSTGLSAYVDTVFQAGVVGLLLLLVAGALAFRRAWTVAATQRSKTHIWPALVLLLFGTTSIAESFVLAEGGLMLAVALATLSAHRMSWRRRLATE